MDITIIPGSIRGNITAPASKSVMQRACAAALIKGGCSTIHRYGTSNDDKAALDVIRQLGASINFLNTHTLEITARNSFTENYKPKISSFHFCESGLTSRMFTPIIALLQGTYQLEGSGSLLQRPFSFFEEILPQLGVKVVSRDGMLPMQVTGPLYPKNISVGGSLSSQFLTGLLMAYSAAKADAVSINVSDLASRPYVDLTLQVLHAFGLPVPRNENYERFVFSGGEIKGDPVTYSIEGDWSSASFLLVAGAIAGEISVSGLDIFSQQADKKILEALQQCGCILSITEKEVTVRSAPLTGFQLDATHCPDLFPPLAALAVCCEGISVIEGVHRLVHKESNRAESLQKVFNLLGADMTVRGDQMIIRGSKVLKGGRTPSFNDHRIAMAAAVAALRGEEAVIIEEAECVAKSYPDFFKVMKNLSLNHH